MSSPSKPESHHEAARRLVGEGKTAKAKEALGQGMREGDPACFHYAGLCFINGWFGGPKLPVPGEGLLRKAIELGSEDAEYDLGSLLVENPREEKRCEEGERWLIRVADRKGRLSAKALECLAHLKRSTSRVGEAIEMLRVSDDRGSPSAAHVLAKTCVCGGVEVTADDFRRLERIATDSKGPAPKYDYDESRLWTAILLAGRDACGVDPDPKRAEKMLLRLTKANHPRSAMFLGEFYRDGYFPDDKAHSKQRRAFQSGVDNGCTYCMIGMAHLEGSRGSAGKYWRWMKCAAKGGNAYAVGVVTGERERRKSAK